MPKRPKFSKEQVIQESYEIIKSSGSDNLSARSLANKLKCGISPIFTLFSSMEEIKEEVFLRVKKEFIDYLKECENYFPMFKEFGLRYVSYCKHNPYLFMFILKKTNGNIKEIIYSCQDFYQLLEKNICENFSFKTQEAHELFIKMMMVASGLSLNIISNINQFSLEELGQYFSQMCIGLVLQMKVKNEELDINMASSLSKQVSNMPVRIK